MALLYIVLVLVQTLLRVVTVVSGRKGLRIATKQPVA